MRHKALLFAAAVLGSGLFALRGQQPAQAGGFTLAQAEEGRKSYENTCGKCHTPTLTGRKGDPGEVPPVSSLPAYMQEMASGPVPALAGSYFLNRWGSDTAAELVDRIEQAVGAFPPEGTNIPVPGHAPAKNDPTSVNITAYVLQVNGAKAGTQPLTKTTEVMVRSMTAEGSTQPAANRR